MSKNSCGRPRPSSTPRRRKWLQPIAHNWMSIHPFAITIFLLNNCPSKIEARDVDTCDLGACAHAEADRAGVLLTGGAHPIAAADGDHKLPHVPYSLLSPPSELVVEVYPSAQALRILYTVPDIPQLPAGAGGGGGHDWGECGMSVAVDGQNVLGSPLR